MKRTIILIFTCILMTINGFSASAKIVKDEFHFRDTLHTPSKQAQFMKAVKVAPETFLYKEAVWHDANTVTFKRMKFNRSMQRTLACDIVKQDPGLTKRLNRLYKIVKPMNPVLDFKVSFHQLDAGHLAISYDLTNIDVFAGNSD